MRRQQDTISLNASIKEFGNQVGNIINSSAISHLLRIIDFRIKENQGYGYEEDIDILQDGQVDFELSETPSENVKAILSINGQIQFFSKDYTVSGKILRWISQDFLLEKQDKLKIIY